MHHRAGQTGGASPRPLAVCLTDSTDDSKRIIYKKLTGEKHGISFKIMRKEKGVRIESSKCVTMETKTREVETRVGRSLDELPRN